MFATIKMNTIKMTIVFILLCIFCSISFSGECFANVFFGSALREVPIYKVDTEEKKVAISFDAAWGADKTEGIMKVLKEYNCQATFFLVGFWVEDYPEIAKKIADNGFEIGTHSNTHPDMVKLDKKEMKLELTKSINTIKEVTGITPTLFRPPFGSYNDTLINTAKDLGLHTIQWSVDSLDWKGLHDSEIYNRIVSQVKNGSIILCHNNGEHTLEALPKILVKLINEGYEFVKIGDLIYKDNYTIDNTGTQKNIKV